MPVDGPGESSKGFRELHLSNHSFIILYDSVVCVDIAPSLFDVKSIKKNKVDLLFFVFCHFYYVIITILVR